MAVAAISNTTDGRRQGWLIRGGRASVGPVVLGSGELLELRQRVDTAVYTSAKREVSLRHEELEGALKLVDAMLAARQAA